MSETLAQELAGHVSRMYRVSLASLMVGIAWLLLPAMSARAESPIEGAQSAASTVGDVHAAPRSVLLLPPRLPAGAGDTVRAAAEAACDRLAQDIAAAGMAKVVNRTELDRILRERSLEAEPSRPMLSYDAMLRLEADTTRLAPETMVSLIDLSTGNIIAQRAFTWPPKEADAKPMLDFCRNALKGVTKPAAGKLRVRSLCAEDAIANERIRPLGKRLIAVFDEALQRSDRVVLVRHLEAATSKEESLLLFLGMSRLPGGRQFSPQADATIELRINEGDGQGKTFPETPVEIGVRLRKGADYEGQWMTTAGLVRDFDALIPQAWQKLSESLGEVHPETATTLLNEMSLRRKQAEAELQAARELIEIGIRQSDNRRDEALAAGLAHTEAAVKLDPTYPDAVCAHIHALTAQDRNPLHVPDIWLYTIYEAARYLDQFRQNGPVCSCLCTKAAFGLECSKLNRLYGLRNYDEPLAPVTRSTLALTPDLVRGLDAVKQLLERGIEEDVEFRFVDADRMTVVTYHGMILLNVPGSERQAWLDSIRGRCGAKIRVTEKRSYGPADDWNEYIRLQIRIAELLMEDGQADRAKQIIVQALAEMPVRHRPWGSLQGLLKAVIAKTNDAQLMANLGRWLNRGKSEAVQLIYIDWPSVDVLAGTEDLNPTTHFEGGLSRLKVVEVHVRRPSECHETLRHQPLAESNGRFYFHVSHLQDAIAYVPLDERGRPIGKALRGLADRVIWDNIKSIPQPKLWSESRITWAQCLNSRLYLAAADLSSFATGSGLHEFDPETGTWKSYGPEQGLPASMVEEFFPIGNELFYCTSATAGHFTLNVTTGAVTLVQRCDDQAGQFINNNLRLLWRNDERLMAVGEYGIWSDLLSKSPKYAPLSHQTCYGWQIGMPPHLGIIGAAEAGGRRFYLCRGGLYEIDSTGKIIRSWWTEFRLGPAGGGLGGLDVVATADCPIRDLPRMFGLDSRLIFADHRHLTVYDLSTDTWYGPIESCGCTLSLTAPNGGLWGQLCDGLFYLSIDDLMACAKSLGRVMTTTEYRQRKQQFIDAAKPLDRAKFTLGMRQFDKAESALQQVLDTEPNQPEALILMGFLHDRNCLNQPDEAIKYYRRAAALEENLVASYSGMFFWLCILNDRQQWKEATDLCEEILQRYPGLDEHERQRIQQLRDHCQQQLAEKDVKQPAAETSNKEERPAE